MTLNRSRLYQGFKYAIYALLAMNVFWFFIEEYAAAKLLFSNGIALAEMIEAYVATIDTAAWVVLLLMFELETFVLDDHHFTKRVTWTLQTVRVVCYAFIIYSFYGYITNMTLLAGITPLADIGNVCALAGQWSYAVDQDEYMAITAANCSSFSSASAFFQFPNMAIVVDADGLSAITKLGWVDVINSGVWLLVVLVLEIDVRLQEHNRFEGAALRISNATKVILYSILIFALIYWALNGDFVDYWDSFLWLVAFFFIELNVVEWRQEAHELQESGQNL